MSNTLFYRPGETGTLVLENFLDGYDGYRTDGYAFPYISQIFLPPDTDGYILPDDGYTIVANYPSNFSKLDEGLFYHKLTLPTGGLAIGTYVVDVSYFDSPDDIVRKISYQVVVQTVSGNLGLRSSS